MVGYGVLTIAPVVALLGLQGCAALPLAGMGGSALESGAGAVVKAGTEYTSGGTAYRTFTIPMSDVRDGVLRAFDRTGVALKEEKSHGADDDITGELKHRTVRVRLTTLSPSLTTMRVVVKTNALSKDRATTSEFLEQVEQVLSENPRFARLLHREPLAAEPAASPGVR